MDLLRFMFKSKDKNSIKDKEDEKDDDHNMKERNKSNKDEEKGKCVRERNPGRVPIILIPLRQNTKPKLSEIKFLVPESMSFSHFVSSVRRHLSMSSEIGLYFYVGNGKSMPITNSLMSDIDSQHQSKDGFVYVYYDLESSFGS